ncbi:MAG TPA: YraN family protein [Terriglobia bacterium]|nr:YraN family protein [Terriglobia bacterium]
MTRSFCSVPVSRDEAGMSMLARLVYRALAWKERRRVRREQHPPSHAPLSLQGELAPHLDSGRRGENLAYWYLRRSGYIVIARNRRPRSDSGELDMVGWDGPVLAFVEVKTRSSTLAGPPELAVSAGQRKRIIHSAQLFMMKLRRKDISYRFDIVSVLWMPGTGFELRLIKDAFKTPAD